MDNTEKVRSFVRLLINRELSKEELAQFFDIVDANALTDTITTFDSVGTPLHETSITLMQQDDTFIYEIPTLEDPQAIESYDMTKEMSEFIADDFEIATTFS